MSKKIIYIYDTLCGWCNISSTTVSRVYEFAMKNDIEFEFYHRRLFVDDYIPEITSDFVDMIKSVGSQTVKKLGLEPFSDDYYKLIETDGFQHNSNMTSIGNAAAFALNKHGELAYKYSKKIQELVFKEGYDPNEESTIIKAAEEIFEIETFREALNNEYINMNSIELAKIAKKYEEDLNEKGVPFLYLYDNETEEHKKLDPYSYDRTIFRINKYS